MHAVIGLLVSRPGHVLEHAEAYAALATLEYRSAAAAWRRRALLGGTVLIGLGMALMLGGVALMLGAAVPLASAAGMAWVLFVVPAVPAAAAAAAALALALQRRADPPTFSRLREQVQADTRLLREASAA